MNEENYLELKNSFSSSEIIASLGVREHPEGGYFVETDRQEELIPTPFVAGKALRSLATSIFYLLTYDRPNGVIHSNKSVIYHVLHQGRAEYTLISPETPPRFQKKIMGGNKSAGETRLLIVGPGVWKMSRLLDKDISNAVTKEEKESVNCLITEVVVPGFSWEDHHFLTEAELADLCGGDEQKMEELSKYIR